MGRVSTGLGHGSGCWLNVVVGLFMVVFAEVGAHLAAILGELAAQPPPRLMIPNGPDAPRWLFPGRIPGQPLDLHSLNNQLNRHGISARPARNGALAALASDLPAAVLADFLGIHVNTAVRWVTYARQDWTAYLAARDADLNSAPDSEGARRTGRPCLTAPWPICRGACSARSVSQATGPGRSIPGALAGSRASGGMRARSFVPAPPKLAGRHCASPCHGTAQPDHDQA
jgi:hypothetical protein